MTDARRWGITPGYHDVAARWHQAPDSTISAFLDAMGAGDPDVADAGPPPGPAVLAAPGRPHPSFGPGELHLEDGTAVPVDGAVPYDLPVGYHRFLAADGTLTPLIVSPGRCWLPDGLKEWGWAAQLYAARSTASWGMGDLADLRRLGQWSAAQGAGITLINPLHAALPVGRQQPSPYFASSRCFRNPLYLRIEEVPGASRLAALPELAAAGRALNDDRRVDRDAVWALKSAALEAIFADFGGSPAFDRYREEQGRPLREYAVFCALSEVHGLPWENWPAQVRRPDAEGITRFWQDQAGASRVRYHSWVQWLVDCQLHVAGQAIGLVQDLAIGTDAGGADAWRWQDCTALGVRVGAPPDEFNVDGQNWAFPPFDPWRLRSAGYQPFIELVRAGLRDAGGMRFDHVMGLFRLYWIPADQPATEGTYVHYPAEDLLDILALESQRAGAFVVGEDLGTVDDAHRIELAARRVMSYRLLYFESSPPSGGQWPTCAMAAATTHDLPTVAGLWDGRDIAARRAMGISVNEEAEEALRTKVGDWIGAPSRDGAGGAGPGGGLSAPEAVERVYRLLAEAPCALITATLDDALAVEERPNMPGTVDEWPNWRIALPRPLEDIEEAPLATVIAAALEARSGGSPSGST